MAPVSLVPRNAAPDMPSELLAAVDALASTIQDDALAGEATARLSSRVVAALRDAGLFRMRLPSECGGGESPIEVQMAVIAALAELDASTAWCVMVGNNAVARIATTMPIETVEQVFAHGVPLCSLVASVAGTATEVEGGYLLTGTWRLATGVGHSQWIYARSFIDGDRSRVVRFVIPTGVAHVEDSWQAIGLRATGSADFTLDGTFLPGDLATTEPERQVRGARRYDIAGLPMPEAYEHLAFAIGVARRALRELADSLARDEVHRRTSDREVVHAEIGRASMRLAAVDALAHAFAARADDAATGGENRLTQWGEAFPRAMAVEATETALQCVTLAFRRGASRSVYSPNIVERLLRDMNTAAAHIVVDDTAFADHGARLLAAPVATAWSM